MKFVKLLIFISATMPIIAMEQPPQPEKSHLERLPGDVQRYLLPFILSSDATRADIETIFSLACVNRYFNTFINQEDTLKRVLTHCASESNHYHETEIAAHMQKMHGMQRPAIQEWIARRKAEIILEEELLIATRNDTAKSFARAKELISQGVDTNIHSKITGNTPLVNAVWIGDIEMVHALLHAGADPNHRFRFISTPLMVAILKKRIDLVELLLKAKADVNTPNHSGHTPLMKAAKYGPIEMVQILLVAGAKVDARSKKHGCTAIRLAVRNGNYSIRDLLIDHERKTQQKALKYP